MSHGLGRNSGLIPVNCSTAASVEGAAQSVIVCVSSSVNWLSLLTPLIIFLSFCAAIAGVLTARSIARQRATLDMIEKVESSSHYRDLHSTFAAKRRAGQFGELHDPKKPASRKQRQQVLDYLNHYELVSIGIQRNTLDPDIYRDWMLGAFLRDWNAAADFIQRERWKWNAQTKNWEYRARVFENYQKLASLWSNETVKLTKDYSKPPNKPTGPGDEHLPETNKDSKKK